LRDERQQEREERRTRRIREQRIAEGKERREFRFFRRRERPPPKKKAVTREDFAEKRANQIMNPQMDSDLDPGDPMSKVIKEQAGPLYYTPPKEAPEGTVDPIDRVVTGITSVMWGRAERLRPSTEPLSYEEQRYRMRRRELPDWDLAMKRAELGALNIGIGAVESFTFPVRPSAWVRTGMGLVGLATSQERRREAVEFAKARPEAVGLQILGGLGGGYAAGRLIGRLRGPKTYTLKEKTIPQKPRVVTSPATKMPRGKWRSTWEITRKGGTAVVQLKERPGYISYYEPTPVYGLSRLGLIGLSGVHGRTTTEVKSDVVEKQTEKQLQRVGLSQRQRGKEREMFAIGELPKGRTEQRREILPDQEPFIRLRPVPTPPGFVEPPVIIQEQRQRQRAITLPDLRLKQTQEQRQAQSIAQIQRMSMREPTPELRIPRRRKKKGEKGELDLFTFGEIRQYRIKGVEELMREMGL